MSLKRKNIYRFLVALGEDDPQQIVGRIRDNEIESF